jgi:Domain of unknown function (DUF4198)
MRMFILALVLAASPVQAHELWLEPVDYTVAAEGVIEAHIVNGQEFGGSTFAYIPKTFARFTMRLGDAEVPVPGRIGDVPALRMQPLGEGLHVAAFQSAGDVVGYKTYKDFARFAAHKDFPDARAEHLARALPETDFKEYYRRFAKTLVAVGQGAGSDRFLGMETEIVALANPYTDDVTAGMPVQVYYRTKPRADVQVELFQKAADGAVTITLHRTDAEGIATLPVLPGHSYLVDAVVLRSPSIAVADGTGAAWETLWADLTFAVPE